MQKYEADSTARRPYNSHIKKNEPAENRGRYIAISEHEWGGGPLCRYDM